MVITYASLLRLSWYTCDTSRSIPLVLSTDTPYLDPDWNYLSAVSDISLRNGRSQWRTCRLVLVSTQFAAVQFDRPASRKCEDHE